jgi:hypothetical protein
MKPTKPPALSDHSPPTAERSGNRQIKAANAAITAADALKLRHEMTAHSRKMQLHTQQMEEHTRLMRAQEELYIAHSARNFTGSVELIQACRHLQAAVIWAQLGLQKADARLANILDTKFPRTRSKSPRIQDATAMLTAMRNAGTPPELERKILDHLLQQTGLDGETSAARRMARKRLLESPALAPLARPAGPLGHRKNK